MFAKTVTQVNYIIVTGFSLLILTILHSHAFANPECPDSWQPTSSRTCYDDLFYMDLEETLRTNIQALKKTGPQSLEVCKQTITTASFIQSYNDLRTYISDHSSGEISNYIEENFSFCKPNQVLITGYYEPEIEASLTKTSIFKVPLYSAPLLEKTKLTATRQTIETTNLLHGYEIVYVADLFTAFTIHVQGSALLTLTDGTQRQVHYQNSNGRPYTSIGRILIDLGLVKREDMSMQAIKNYCQTNPQKTAPLIQNNERFIYFTLSAPVKDPEPPSGSFNIPLTPNRSIALDPKLYPQGLLFHLQGTLPVPRQAENQQPQQFHRRAFSRFMLNQDSGNAIKGHQRVDLFMGRGETAEIMAGEMQENGCLRVLLPK